MEEGSSQDTNATKDISVLLFGDTDSSITDSEGLTDVQEPKEQQTQETVVATTTTKVEVVPDIFDAILEEQKLTVKKPETDTQDIANSPEMVCFFI